MKIKWYIIISIVILICGMFIGHVWTKSAMDPEVIHTSDTTYIYDTITHEIPVDHYITRIDTIFYPDSIWIPNEPIDTAEILRDYYAVFNYDRTWSDTLIKVNFTDQVTRNRIVSSSLLHYKLLKPTQNIINTTTYNNYNNYITLSLDTDFQFKAPAFGVNYVGKTFGGGIRYYPIQNAWGAGISYTLFKIK